ncbi:MAG: formate/nitrite transporter family protein [Oscillospiraceae bacterium]|jgi:formate/nitrite transporter|nr:formate/nitrite transporter family protein [Oscillospiraceae bacterium]
MFSPKEVAQNYIATGIAKTKNPISKMLLLAILAGMFIALAGVGATIGSVTIASASLAKIVSAVIFPVGLVMVLVAGSELFTGNNLLIIPVMEKQVKVSAMLKNWFFVYLGNLIGGILVAALVVYGHTFSVFSNEAAASVIKTAVAKVSLSFGDAFLRGILCNFLVCIAVWISFAAKDVVGKIVGLFLPIMTFVLSGYEHSVANMYYISAGLFAQRNPAYAAAVPTGTSLMNLTWGNMFAKNLLPVTLGNIVGGMVLVGLVYWFVYLRNADKDAKAKQSPKQPVHK